MQKIKIEENKKIECSNQIVLFDNPSNIMISLIKDNDIYLPLLKKGDYVYQEEKIALRKYDHFPIFSTVSGIIEFIDNEKIIIKNDLKNRVKEYSIVEYPLTNYHKQDVCRLLFDLGVRNIGNEDLEPYQKLTSNGIYKTLIINVLREDAYFYIELFQLKMERKQILEIIDFFIDIYNFEEVLIVVPNNEELLVEELAFLTRESRIKIIAMEEYYSLAHPRKLILQLKKIKYYQNSIEKGIVVFNVSTLLSIYYSLKYQRPQIKMLVQFTGNMWKKNCYMEVRIGTCLKEVMKKLEFKRAKEIILLKGSLMSGKNCDLENTIINVNTEFYSAWQAKEVYEEESCIRCGRCAKVCPIGLNPALIMKHYLKKKNLFRFGIEFCIECGLCSYVCPSNILVHKYVEEAKEIIE